MMKVFAGMFVLRGIAASHVPAYKAHSQMYPAVSHLHALFANVRTGRCDFDLIGMCASCCHSFRL